MKILQKIARLFLPSAETIAGYAAERIAETINTSGKEELISRYAKAAEYLSTAQKMLEDGKLSAEETETVKDMLVPMVKKLLELI